ncbi:MAG: radical SAM protein [Thermoprotei archaeon]|nr:MAG: radical SAM protein [Thermoprotei archaeon]
MRRVVKVDGDLPLIGCIAFGIIDRGTNLLQIRVTTLCPYNCIYCSVDAGPHSRTRQTEYVITDVDYLVETLRQVIEYKGVKHVEAHLDGVGEVMTYDKIVELVQKLSEIPQIKVISMQTRGYRFTYHILDELADAGLSRVNLSIDALDSDLAKYMAGVDWYNVEEVINYAEYIVRSTKMDLLIAPVWVPGINDREIPRLIEWAKRIGAGKRWPPLGIQKFVVHKRGRKPRGVREMRWSEFYRWLRKWEKEFGIKLVLSPEDFQIFKTRSLPTRFRVGERIWVKVVEWGWQKGELLGVCGDRLVTIVGVRSDEGEYLLGKVVRVEVIENKHNIYLARLHL